MFHLLDYIIVEQLEYLEESWRPEKTWCYSDNIERPELTMV